MAGGEFNVGGTLVQSFNDDLFHAVRAKYGAKPDFLKQFDFKTLRMFGGKGGQLMAFTADRRFLVKELPMGDHASLLAHTPDIVARIKSDGSLICPLFLHFERSTKHYVVMRNVLPVTSGLTWHKLYDLKGNRDDKLLVDDGMDVPEVHKRCFHVHRCWYGCDVVPGCSTDARKRYYEGKKHSFTTQFTTSDAQAVHINSMIAADSRMFGAAGLMDYSLMVGVIRQGSAELIPPADGLNQFVVKHGGWTYIYYIGIIDFLQAWTSTKKIAAAIKAPFAPKPLSTVPPLQYAQQFEGAFKRKFAGELREVARA
jgi:hypothetical protein